MYPDKVYKAIYASSIFVLYTSSGVLVNKSKIYVHF